MVSVTTIRIYLTEHSFAAKPTDWTPNHESREPPKRESTDTLERSADQRKRRGGKQKEIQKSPSPTRSRSIFSRLGSEERKRKERGRRSPSQASSRSASVFSRLGAKRQKQRRKDVREVIQSYVPCSSERQQENEREYRRSKWEDSRDEPLEIEDSAGGRHWKRQSRRAQKEPRYDMSEPYDEESTTPFTRRINKFFPQKEFGCPPPSKHITGHETQKII
ncbi:hypothetical protein Tco_1002960 [Tanacetum coccineum]|uniref:Uncharacterized protein n=1 Tax=Tanacetum coccineum TaxID=301880 RepID=A0ABQ5F9M4_9ASTR